MNKLILAISVLVLAAFPALAQQQQQPKPSPEPVDVIKVDTNLVQTTVTVLDKGGKFVDGLRQEDFQLKVDGRPVTITFFSRVTAGSAKERSQLASLRNGQVAPTSAGETEVRGRTIVFFIDDLHLSAASVHKTRETITNFVTNQMGPNDLVAVASATGGIGFLQQFTDNKSVLKAAVARLVHRPYVIQDTEQIGMTEYAALRIDSGDKDALTYYANEWLKATKFRSPGGAVGPPSGGGAVASSSASSANRSSAGLSREIAERQVKERASMMLRQSTNVTASTLAGFENLVRTAAQQNGRKLAFFISDGFYLNDRNTGFNNKLREVIDLAVRSGIVVYSLDARGLVSGTDVTSNRADPEGKLARSNIGELAASQDAMNALAGDTGGRALFNSEQLSNAIDRALKETSEYYLLAWRPESEEQKGVAFKKLDITVAGRSDVSVRLPKGYLANAAATTATATAPEAKPSATDKPADVDLKRALSATYTQDNIPTTVSVSYVDAPGQGAIVTAGVHTSATSLDYGPDNKQAAVDVAGVILNDQGKVAGSFRTRLLVNAIPEGNTTQDTGVVYNYKAKLTPGLYQLRAAVRDEKSGKVGSSTQWVEIPDLTNKRLAVSSVLLRSVKKGAEPANSSEPQFKVDHHFSRASQLNFLMFVYNASPGSNAKPDLTAQVEVFRNGASVISTPVRTLSMEGMTDLAHIPYGGQFPLASLTAGRYELQITITDRLAKTSASQRLKFDID